MPAFGAKRTLGGPGLNDRFGGKADIPSGGSRIGRGLN